MKADVINQSVYECCLMPLLTALRWHGSKRHLKESMPHFLSIDSASMFCDVLENLNYRVRDIRTQLHQVDSRIFPCLFVADNGAVMVLLSQTEKTLTVFDGAMNTQTQLDLAELVKKNVKGVAYAFKPVPHVKKRAKAHSNWLVDVLKENKPLVYTAFLLSFILSLLSIATPIFIMAVYDKVIGAASYEMLSGFLVGIFLAFLGIYVLHKLRSVFLSLVGARLDQTIGNRIFSRLLYLPPIYTETATVGSQVARIRDFDRLREFLSGPMLSIFFELPFIIISLAIVSWIGGGLVIVPLVMISAYALLALIMRIKAKSKIKKISLSNTEMQEFLLESVNEMRALKYTAAQKVWYQRFRDFSASCALANFRVTLLAAINNAISDAIMIGSGMAVLAVGAIKVIQGQLTVGALLAVMILVWRILSPLKTIFNVLPRLQQINSSFRQIKRLMNIPPEAKPKELVSKDRRAYRGDIQFHRISFRYQTNYGPSLMGVDFTIKFGSVVGVVGHNGSGKSTLLKILLGLYQPQAGSIRIDNRDIRQLNSIDLRSKIAYLPQNPELFYGTVAANLRMADPIASDEDIHWALDQAGILQEVLALPNGVETWLHDHSASTLPSSLQQSLCLARAYIKKTSILLLDEPGNVLDTKADSHLLETIQQLRGNTTVVMVTHRPSHLKITDQMLLLDQGQLISDGTPEQLMPKLFKEFL